MHRNGIKIKELDRALEIIIKTYPSYLEEFEQIINLAPKSDKKFIKLLYDHEQAYIDFAHKEMEKSSVSLSLLERCVREHKNFS